MEMGEPGGGITTILTVCIIYRGGGGGAGIDPEGEENPPGLTGMPSFVINSIVYMRPASPLAYIDLSSCPALWGPSVPTRLTPPAPLTPFSRMFVILTLFAFRQFLIQTYQAAHPPPPSAARSRAFTTRFTN